jgi:hypothetical protein
MLSRINKESYNYIYQVPLRPGQELYPAIGTFSHLFGLDENETFEVLKLAGLVGIEGKQRKVSFKTQQWDMIATNISGFFWNKYGKHKAFVFGIGSKGLNKNAMASQIKAKQAPPKFGCLHLLCKEFETKWKAVKEAPSSNEEARSSNEEARSSEAVARSSETEAPSNPEENCVLNFDGITDDDDVRPNLKKNKRKHRLTMLGKQEHPMPKGWKGCHRLRLDHLEEKAQVVKNIEAAASKERCNQAEEMRLILGTFASRWPQVSDTAVEQLLAAGGIQLASQTKLLDFVDGTILEFDDIAESLEPSRTSVTNSVIHTAAHKVIVNADRLAKAKRVYIGCDKGGGVLIKMAFFWCAETRQIVELNLNFDKSGDKAKHGGEAIKHSMEKYTFGKREWDIGGGSSDAGGGFTGKAMKKALVAEKLADVLLYIHINCTSHNDQTNLRVSIEKVYGAGGREKRNVCQLIHAFSDTQQLFEKIEVNPIMRSAWRYEMGDEVEVPRDFMELMQEPILT